MALRLYADECVDVRIVFALRARGVDIVNALELDLLGANDTVHADRAATLGRIVVTADTDFLSKLPAGGLIFIKPTTALGVAITKLKRIAKTRTSEEVHGRIEWIRGRQPGSSCLPTRASCSRVASPPRPCRTNQNALPDDHRKPTPHTTRKRSPALLFVQSHRHPATLTPLRPTSRETARLGPSFLGARCGRAADSLAALRAAVRFSSGAA